MFPDSAEIYLVNISRSQGEAVAGMGDLEKADKLFQALAEKFPSNEWMYIWWGDLFGILRPKDQPLQYERAKAIYEMGLDRCSRKSHMGPLERLSDLGTEYATLAEETNH
ncbi:MAG: hypothetical protein PHV61_10210 [Limnochordia bacterium]|nr:hypothetical protein [Limnochordia bacterium]MDD4517911.1 hypothetical protein [Limnochordia bacterium]